MQFYDPDNEDNKKLTKKSAKQGKVDNGRVLECHGCSMIITEIDYNIIKSQYKWDDIKITRVKVAKKKMTTSKGNKQRRLP